MNRILKSTEIVRCEDNDRLILIVREDDRIVGLNYMQGDELRYFYEFYGEDPQLTIYYNTVAPYLRGKTEIDRINQAIWGYFDYTNSIYKLGNKS